MNIDASLPDELVRAADGLAARLGVSRSDVIVTALGEYVAKHEDAEIVDLSAWDRHRRLAEACGLLDPAEERAVAEGRGEPD